jgi:hypothetical protein
MEEAPSQEIVSDVAGDREKSSVTPPPTAVNPFGNFWVDVLLMLFYLFIFFFSLLKHFRSTSSIKKIH